MVVLESRICNLITVGLKTFQNFNIKFRQLCRREPVWLQIVLNFRINHSSVMQASLP